MSSGGATAKHSRVNLGSGSVHAALLAQVCAHARVRSRGHAPRRVCSFHTLCVYVYLHAHTFFECVPACEKEGGVKVGMLAGVGKGVPDANGWHGSSCVTSNAQHP